MQFPTSWHKLPRAHCAGLFCGVALVFSAGWMDPDQASALPPVDFDAAANSSNARVEHLMLSRTDATTSTGMSPDPLQLLAVPQSPGASLDAEAAGSELDSPEPESGLRHEIRSGETLGNIFLKHGLGARTLNAVLAADQELLALDVLRPGHVLEFELDPEAQQLEQLRLILRPGHRIEYTRVDDHGFEFEEFLQQGDWEQEIVTGEVHGSFYVSARRAGLSDREIMEIQSIYDSRVNFRRELRAGDRFSILLGREQLPEGATGRTRVEAIQLGVNGRDRNAFLYSDGNYYDEDGSSLTPAFLRYPVEQRYRISSHFNLQRRHPVTGRIAPHHGTDFATPVGTPVMSTGDGIVTRVGDHPFAGKYVEIEHHGQFQTRYLHLHRILVRQGQRVERGQRIALSGNTGRTTGPHLHFELHVDNRPVNAMTADIPEANSLAEDEMVAFSAQVEALLAALEQDNVQLARRYQVMTDSES